MNKTQHLIVLDIGGTNIRIGLLNQYQILSFVKYRSSDLEKSSNPIATLATWIRNVCKEFQISGVVLGIAGILDENRVIVKQMPYLKFLECPIKQLLESELQVPVLLERDINLIHYYHIKNLAFASESIVLGFYLGTGLGFAASFGTKILVGAHGIAGELGHVPIYGNNENCSCGSVGCAETLLSGHRLAKLHQELWPNEDITKVFSHYPSEPKLVEFIDLYSDIIATMVNIFDPKEIILGGTIVNMDFFPLDALLQKSNTRFRCSNNSQNEVRKFHFPVSSDSYGLIGGAFYFYDKIQL